MKKLRLATRGSDLATTQSGMVAAAVEAATGAVTELVIVKTIGDARLDVHLAEVGSVGLFTKEVQDAVLDGRADYAVHSLKDLPAEQTAGLCCAAIPVREDTRDWLLIRPGFYGDRGAGLLPLIPGTRVGTSAARRTAFLADMAPDCTAVLLRGNVPTRVNKLIAGDYDAILLAGAGLRRLDLDLANLQVVKLDPMLWPGAPGQGALAIECRADDQETRDLIGQLHHPATAATVEAERSLLRALGGGCGLPLGASALAVDGGFQLVAALGPTEDFPGKLRRAKITATDVTSASAAALEALLAAEVI
jgi:hydroxymethylbilane synthase